MILFLEWFLRHPSMRYGGYVLFALPIFLFISRKLETYQLTEKRLHLSTIFLILSTILIYEVRNIKRINYEMNFYGYDLINSPNFNVLNVDYEIISQNKNFKIYKPINGMCWATPTPCSYRESLKAKSYMGINSIQENDK